MKAIAVSPSAYSRTSIAICMGAAPTITAEVGGPEVNLAVLAATLVDVIDFFPCGISLWYCPGAGERLTKEQPKGSSF
jgi:hypothetical protein